MVYVKKKLFEREKKFVYQFDFENGEIFKYFPRYDKAFPVKSYENPTRKGILKFEENGKRQYLHQFLYCAYHNIELPHNNYIVKFRDGNVSNRNIANLYIPEPKRKYRKRKI